MLQEIEYKKQLLNKDFHLKHWTHQHTPDSTFLVEPESPGKMTAVRDIGKSSRHRSWARCCNCTGCIHSSTKSNHSSTHLHRTHKCHSVLEASHSICTARYKKWTTESLFLTVRNNCLTNLGFPEVWFQNVRYAPFVGGNEYSYIILTELKFPTQKYSNWHRPESLQSSKNHRFQW